MRLVIRYASHFTYPSSVWESHNVLRACPTTDERQTLLQYSVVTSPPARVQSWTDHWGTRVDAFGVRAPHDKLEIRAEAVVETLAAGPMTSAPSWRRLSDARFIEDHLEYLEPSPHARWNEALRAEAERRAAPAGADVVGAVLSLHRYVGSTLEYVPGATEIGVDVSDVLRSRKGVCQDFAHVLIALVRSLGIPARYVSGYVFSAAEGEPAAREAAPMKTHAWVEVAVPGAGWWGLDPTNRSEVGPRHVKIGHGRDYDDVLPLRGVYQGQGDPRFDVSVRIRRESQTSQQ